MVRVTRGALVEYSLAVPPLALVFDFNPRTITRTRSITVPKGAAGSQGSFASPTDTPRVALGVTTEPETFSIEILLDATDRMNDGDSRASTMGIEPEIDVLRTMVEPKSQGPGGVQLLASLGVSEPRAFQRDRSASVLLFVWGPHVLPVFLTSVRLEETAHLPSLVPYRATAELAMQVIEGQNPFYLAETARQIVGAGIATDHPLADIIGGLS